MNLPEAQKRIEEINEETGMTDPFPKFDQPDPPPPVEAPETEQADEGEEVEQGEAEATEAETPEEEAPEEAADAAIVEAEDDDIAWVRANKGFEVSDPIVAKTLRNQEEMIRRQGTEVGEARKRIEQTQKEWEAFQARQEQMLEEQFEPDEAWEDWVDEGLLVDVQQTLTAAMEAGGDPAFNYAVSRWHLIDPVAATAFQIEFSKPEYHQPPAAPAQANDPDSVWARGLSRHPDLKDYEQAMTAVLESDPEIRERMYRHASIDPDAALDSLYNLVWRQQTDKQRSDALAKANAARAAQADASARDATVASATASAGHGEGRPLTEAEQVRANIRAELGLVIPD